MENKSCVIPKPALKIDEQIELLKKRGLLFKDEERAYCILCHTNYYKLRGYFIDFYEADNSFRNNTMFENIYDCYLFGLSFHKGVLPILETVETSLKTLLANFLSLNYGALCYKDLSIYKYPDNALNIMQNAKKYINNHKKSKIVIKHEKDYGGEYPIWVWIGFLSFGDVSLMCSSLNDDIISKINMEFYLFHKRIGIDFLRSWYRSVSKFRNICSHYERLYAMRLLETPSRITTDSRLNKDYNIADNTNLFYYVLVADMICPDIQVVYMFIEEIKKLCKKYTDIDFNEKYKFPIGWEEILLKYNGYYIQYLI